MSSNKKTLWKKILALTEKHPQIIPVLAALGVIIFLAIIYKTIQYMDGGSRYYAIAFGTIFGLVCGYFLQTRISQNIKIGTVGIFGGMGLDLMANNLSQDATHKTITAINSLGSFISGQYTSIALQDPQPATIEEVERSFTLGLWVSILVIALVLICAKIFTPKKEEDAGG